MKEEGVDKKKSRVGAVGAGFVAMDFCRFVANVERSWEDIHFPCDNLGFEFYGWRGLKFFIPSSTCGIPPRYSSFVKILI